MSKKVLVKLINKEELVKDIYKFKIESREIAEKALPRAVYKY